MKLVIFSDLHYTDAAHYVAGGRKLTQYAEELMQKMAEEIQKTQPDACVFLGDFIEDAGEHDASSRILKEAVRLFEKITVPVYFIPGNHEYKHLGQEEVSQILKQERFTYATNIDGWHLVFLGLGVDENKTFDRSRFLTSEDLAWLKNDLDAHAEPTLVFCHFGIAEDDMSKNYWFMDGEDSEIAFLENRAELKQIFQGRENIKAVFSGHQHWTRHLIEDGIGYHVVGSLVEDVRSDGVPDGVFFEVNASGSDVEVLERHLKIN